MPIDELVSLDRWAVGCAAKLQRSIEQAYERYDFHSIYQALHNFCVVEMGGFYLDIIKDRLYTTGTDSHPRRSAQTAMFVIAEAMTRWIAPIMSFTAEEVWREMPGDRDASVFFSTWYELPDPESAQAKAINWEPLIRVRESVLKALEDLRVAEVIGSGLDASIEVFADGELFEQLQRLGDELRFVFITSEARVRPAQDRPQTEGQAGDGRQLLLQGDGFWVAATVTAHEKCIRCWHRRPEVGQVPGHPEICQRCAGNVEGPGEVRRFA